MSSEQDYADFQLPWEQQSENEAPTTSKATATSASVAVSKSGRARRSSILKPAPPLNTRALQVRAYVDNR